MAGCARRRLSRAWPWSRRVPTSCRSNASVRSSGARSSSSRPANLARAGPSGLRSTSIRRTGKHRVRRRGVAPERIRRRTPVDLLQLGKQPIEEPALGHLQQPGRNAGTRAEQVEHSAAIVGIRNEIFCREVVEALLNTLRGPHPKQTFRWRSRIETRRPRPMAATPQRPGRRSEYRRARSRAVPWSERRQRDGRSAWTWVWCGPS